MEEKKASMTAIVAAFGRAYHSLYDEPKIFDDNLAKQVLTDDEFRNISKHMAEGIKFFNPKQAYLYTDEASALRWVIQTQISPTPLARSRYTEDMLEKAIKLGVKQYVILGAGLDTFVFRKPELLKKIKVFEVDHPVTQKLKLKRIKELDWRIDDSINYIPVDFSKDNLEQALIDSGFKTNEQSFFSWLGVTYYLTKQEIRKMLCSIANISIQGSRVVFDYPDGDVFDSNKTSQRVQAMVSMAKMAGEPMKIGLNYSDLENILKESGFLIYEHLIPEDIENQFFKGRDDYYHAFENINYVLAVVDKKE